MTTKTSSSFSIYSLDSNGYLIDEVTSYLTLTMTQGKIISSLSISADSYIVGDTGVIYTIGF